jgi:Flp pilus assembly protein TadD
MVESDTSPSLRQGWLWLSAAVLLIYAQVATHEFNNYDDTTYITRNPHVTGGLTPQGVHWAFHESTLGMWHPLTGLAHMLDWQLFGAWAGGHLAVNVVLHALNAGLLFVLLRRMTGAGWPSFAVALLFAVHPLNVESVAWASQRKSTLSGLFFLLTLLTWQRYKSKRSILAYLLSVGLYALGLMSKPMLVSLPGVLLLLDLWPLRKEQWRIRGTTGLLIEKAPFVVLALAATVILLNSEGSSMPGLGLEPGFSEQRWLRAGANLVVYLRRLVWPTDLAVLYPHRSAVPAPELLGAIAVLGAMTALAWRGRWPLLVGWLWFLGIIFPVSGVMPIGPHEQADRYAYLPGIGLFIMAVWLIPPRFWDRPRWQTGAVIAAVGLAFGAVSWWQAGFWRNSLTLWTRAVALYPPSVVQQVNYGNALSEAGRNAEAERCFELVAGFVPNDPQAFINLATIRNQRGEKAAAMALLEQVLRADPGNAQAHGMLGSFLHDVGRVTKARQHLETAIRLDPNLGSAHLNLGVLLAQQGDLADAERCFETAARLLPEDPAAEQNLALVRRQLAGLRKQGPP